VPGDGESVDVQICKCVAHAGHDRGASVRFFSRAWRYLRRLTSRDMVSVVPTVLLTEGCRFFFFSNEGTEPPHIHIERGDGYAKFWLEPVELVDAVGMKTRELGRARLLVIQHRIDFREKWREYFGT
jgi:hypothetical protein